MRCGAIEPTYLSGPLGVLSTDKHPTQRADPMFRINLKRSIATVSVIVGALAVAGPASASSTPLETSTVSGLVQAPSGQAGVVEPARGFIESQYVPTSAGVIDTARARGLKLETEVTDYLQRRIASGIDVWGLDRRVFSGDAYDNEMGITTPALVTRPNSEIRPS